MARANAEGQFGFTLLEAIVALTIFAAVGMALYAWINQSIRTIARAEQAQREAASTKNALAFLETVNPMKRAEGLVELGETRVEWRSEAVRGPMPSRSRGGGKGLHDVALYRVDATVYHERRPVRRLTLYRAGWRYEEQRLLEEIEG